MSYTHPAAPRSLCSPDRGPALEGGESCVPRAAHNAEPPATGGVLLSRGSLLGCIPRSTRLFWPFRRAGVKKRMQKMHPLGEHSLRCVSPAGGTGGRRAFLQINATKPQQLSSSAIAKQFVVMRSFSRASRRIFELQAARGARCSIARWRNSSGPARCRHRWKEHGIPPGSGRVAATGLQVRFRAWPLAECEWREPCRPHPAD